MQEKEKKEGTEQKFGDGDVREMSKVWAYVSPLPLPSFDPSFPPSSLSLSRINKGLGWAWDGPRGLVMGWGGVYTVKSCPLTQCDSLSSTEPVEG